MTDLDPEAHPTPPEPDSDPRWRPTPTKIAVAVILLVAIVLPLLVSAYDIDQPRILGFPFFYAYQLVWVFIAAGLCGLSFWLLQRERAAWARTHRGEGLAQAPGPDATDGGAR